MNEEIMTIVVGVIDPNGYEIKNRVISSQGISPAIRTFQGGGLQPKIITIENINHKKQIHNGTFKTSKELN